MIHSTTKKIQKLNVDNALKRISADLPNLRINSFNPAWIIIKHLIHILEHFKKFKRHKKYIKKHQKALKKKFITKPFKKQWSK